MKECNKTRGICNRNSALNDFQLMSIVKNWQHTDVNTRLKNREKMGSLRQSYQQTTNRIIAKKKSVLHNKAIER